MCGGKARGGTCEKSQQKRLDEVDESWGHGQAFLGRWANKRNGALRRHNEFDANKQARARIAPGGFSPAFWSLAKRGTAVCFGWAWRGAVRLRREWRLPRRLHHL